MDSLKIGDLFTFQHDGKSVTGKIVGLDTAPSCKHKIGEWLVVQVEKGVVGDDEFVFVQKPKQ